MATHDKFDPDWKNAEAEEEDKGYLTTTEAGGCSDAEEKTVD